MLRVYLFFSTVTLIAGVTPIAARMATAELPPLTLGFVRFLIAGALLRTTARALDMRIPFRREDAGILILLATLCVPINQVGFLVGVKLANASHAAIAYALVPVLVYWISLILKRATLTARLLTASLLAFLGAVITVASTGRFTISLNGPAFRMLIGDVLLLSAASSWALFIVFSQPVVKRCGAIQTLTIVFLIGAALDFPLVLADYGLFQLRSFDPMSVTWRGLFGFAFITLVTAYTNYLLWYLVIARYDVTRSSIAVNASFLISVGLEAVLFRLPLSWWVLVGSAVLLTGIALSRVHQPRAEVIQPASPTARQSA